MENKGEKEDLQLNSLDFLLKSNNDLNSLKEDKLRKEKELKNLVINKIKKIELTPNENIELNTLNSLLKSNNKLNSLF